MVRGRRIDSDTMPLEPDETFQEVQPENIVGTDMAYEYITPAGVILPDTADLKTTVQQEWTTAFGGDIDLNPETPQGVMIDAEVASRSGVLVNNATVAMQVNPNYAGGIFLDAIWALTGGQRTAKTRTQVNGVMCYGVPGTMITAGLRAVTVAGDQFEAITTTQIPAVGYVAVPFQSVDYGPVPCPSNTLTSIVAGYGAVGWESVNNPTEGVLGTTTQSDQSARIDRKNTLALQGSRLSVAITSRLYATEGVKSVAFRENTDSAPATIDGVSMSGKSMWACVDGGMDSDVALALLNAKSGGCAWNGAVEYEILDDVSGQKYTAKWDRPEVIAVLARVTVKALSAKTDPTTIVKAAILAYAAGEIEGEPGFVLGGYVSPFELAAAINSYSAGISVKTVEVALAGVSPVYQTTTIDMALWQKASIQESSIQVILI